MHTTIKTRTRTLTPHTHNRQNLGIFCRQKNAKKNAEKNAKENKLNKPYKLEFPITHDTYIHKKHVQTTSTHTLTARMHTTCTQPPKSWHFLSPENAKKKMQKNAKKEIN